MISKRALKRYIDTVVRQRLRKLHLADGPMMLPAHADMYDPDNLKKTIKAILNHGIANNSQLSFLRNTIPLLDIASSQIEEGEAGSNAYKSALRKAYLNVESASKASEPGSEIRSILTRIKRGVLYCFNNPFHW